MRTPDVRRAAGALLGLIGIAVGAVAQCEVAKVFPVPGQGFIRFGWSVAMDGNRAVVGQLGASTQEPAEAWIYEWTGQAWLEKAEIPSPGPPGSDGFGQAVALDDELVVVAAPSDDQAGLNFGAVYVFERNGGAWPQVAKLLPSSPATGSFGAAVAITGRTVIVGAPIEFVPDTGEDDGAVYVFEEVGTTWTEVQKLYGTDQEPFFGLDRFGDALAVDGDRLVVGSPETSDNGSPWKGTVYVFDRAGGTWSETAQIAPDFPMDDGASYGASLDVCGNRLIVGAPFDDFGPGTVLLYDEGPQGWAETVRFDSLDFNTCFNCVGSFGISVALDGDTALIGDHLYGPNPNGSVHVLARQGTSWVPTGRIFASDGDEFDEFGFALALDGDRALISSPWDDTPGQGSLDGSAYFYDFSSPPVAYCTGKANSLGCVAAVSSYGIASATSPLPFDVRASLILNNKPGLLFYGTTGRANLPFLGGTLCVQPPLQRTAPQTSGGDPPPGISCSGAFTFDFNALVQGGTDPDLVPGTVVDAQYWSRDADQPDGTGVHLTEAIEFTVCP